MVKIKYVEDKSGLGTYNIIEIHQCCWFTKKHLIDPFKDKHTIRNNIMLEMTAAEGAKDILKLKVAGTDGYYSFCVECGAPTEIEEIPDRLVYVKEQMHMDYDSKYYDNEYYDDEKGEYVKRPESLYMSTYHQLCEILKTKVTNYQEPHIHRDEPPGDITNFIDAVKNFYENISTLKNKLG